MSAESLQSPPAEAAGEVPSDAELDTMERTASRRTHRFRAWLARRHVSIRVGYRALIAVVGGVVIVLGLILVPLPGPGWLVVFGGLAILSTEFAWARRVARWLRARLASFWAWWKARRAARRATRARRAVA